MSILLSHDSYIKLIVYTMFSIVNKTSKYALMVFYLRPRPLRRKCFLPFLVFVTRNSLHNIKDPTMTAKNSPYKHVFLNISSKRNKVKIGRWSYWSSSSHWNVFIEWYRISPLTQGAHSLCFHSAAKVLYVNSISEMYEYHLVLNWNKFSVCVWNLHSCTDA